MTFSKNITLAFDSHVLTIEPNIRLVSEIEDELGPLAELQSRFSQQKWKVAELVTLIHIILYQAGMLIDYQMLSHKMITDGLAQYLSVVLQLFKKIGA